MFTRLIHRIKTRSYLLGVTATVSLFAGLIISSRFAYVFYLGDNDIQGNFLDFKWMSAFLYTMGIEVSFLSFALILAYATRFMETRARGPFMFLAYSISYVGFFFTSWILLDETKYTQFQEMLFSLGGASLSVGVIYFFSRMIRGKYNFLKQTIRNLFSFIYVETDQKGYIKEEMREEYAKRRINLVDDVLEHE